MSLPAWYVWRQEEINWGLYLELGPKELGRILDPIDWEQVSRDCQRLPSEEGEALPDK